MKVTSFFEHNLFSINNIKAYVCEGRSEKARIKFYAFYTQDFPTILAIFCYLRAIFSHLLIKATYYDEGSFVFPYRELLLRV